MKQLTVIGLGNMGMKYLRDLATRPFSGWQVSGQTTSPVASRISGHDCLSKL